MISAYTKNQLVPIWNEEGGKGSRGGVIFRYSWRTENSDPSTYIHGEIYSLNLIFTYIKNQLVPVWIEGGGRESKERVIQPLTTCYHRQTTLNNTTATPQCTTNRFVSILTAPFLFIFIDLWNIVNSFSHIFFLRLTTLFFITNHWI